MKLVSLSDQRQKQKALEEERLNQKVEKAIELYKAQHLKIKELEKKQDELKKLIQAKQVRVASVKAYSLPENEAKAFIYQKESGNRPDAINRSSGACGLGQALPCSKMGCSLTDYACQDAWFTNYCLRRYGSWENAYKFWLSHHWW